MPQIFDRPLARICVRIFADDYKYILEMADASDVSANLIIRNITSNYVKNLRDKERVKIDQLGQPSDGEAK